MEREQDEQRSPDLVRRPYFLGEAEEWVPFSNDTGFQDGEAARIGEIAIYEELEVTDID